MSLLTVVQRVNALVGLRRPSVAVGTTTSAQIAELARLSTEELSTRADWIGIKESYQFTTVAAQRQPGALPDDFARFTFKGGIYGSWGRIAGPIEDDKWNDWLSYPNLGGSLNGSFRVFGDGVEIFTAPPAGQLMRYDYITTYLYKDAAGNPKLTWELDTDVCRIPENIVALDTLWRYKHAKGLDYAEDMKTAEAAIAKASGTEGGGRAPIRVGRARMSAETYAYPGVLGPR